MTVLLPSGEAMDFQVAGGRKGRIQGSMLNRVSRESGSRFLMVVGGALVLGHAGIAQESVQKDGPVATGHAPGTTWVETVPVGAPLPYQNSLPFQAPAPVGSPAPFQAPLPVPSTNDAPNTAASQLIPRPVSAEESVINLNFQNAPVAEILSMIANQSGLSIIVNGDVTGTIPNVDLHEVTPEAAIRNVALAAGIDWRKTSEGVYVVARTLPPDLKVDPRTLPREESITPYDGSGKMTYVQIPDISNIPQLAPSNLSAPSQANLPLNYYRVAAKNVPIRVLAYMLDPQHQPEPLVLRQSRVNAQQYNQQYLGKSMLSPQDMAAQTGGYLPPEDYYNPYGTASAPNESSYAAYGGGGQFSSPYTQGNAQFGGFGNNGGGNGRNGGGNGRNGGGNGRNGGGNGRNGGNGGGFGGGGGGGLFDLPEGVDQIISVDPQNALLVYATEQGYQQLQTIINLLDRPLRQVEIEAQFISVNTSDTDAFGIDFSSQNGPFTVSGAGFQPGDPSAGGSFTLGFVRNNFRATLKSLLVRNRAKIVTAPRVTAINNLTASLQSSQATPVVTTNAAVQGGVTNTVTQGQNVNYVQTQIGLTVTPTINNDGTITVVMQPQVQQQSNNAGGIAPTITTQSVNTVANLRDGDTIVLGGLREKSISRLTSKVPILADIPLIGKLFTSKNDVARDTDLIIFLTAHVLPRYEEDAVPGT